jgi:hypothetical protein
MGVKFPTGLGTFSDPTTPSGQVSQNQVTGVPGAGTVNITVDHTQPTSFGLGTPVLPSSNPGQTLASAGQTAQASEILPTQTGLQLPNYVTANVQTTLSAVSAQAPYETLFDDFELQCWSTYNFWTADELTNDTEALGNRQLSDVPRYITLSWNTAPDLPSPIQQAIPASLSTRAIQPVKFSSQLEQGTSYPVRGIMFSPDHLQPANFSLVRQTLINGILAPGTIEAVVELPLKNAGADPSSFSQVENVQHIDEDAFLSHPETAGISINELQAQVDQLTSGIGGAAAVAGAGMAGRPAGDRDQFFNGNFTINLPSAPGAPIQIHNSEPSSAPLSLVAAPVKIGSESPAVDPMLALISKVVQPAPVSAVQQEMVNKVKFVDPAIGGIVGAAKVGLMTKQEHAENVMALSTVLPNLEALSQAAISSIPRQTKIQSYRSPPGLPQVEYVGYVIEKYSRTPAGDFEKDDEIEIPHREYSEYVDTKICYGVWYRYRIRAIARWTRQYDVGVFGKDPLTVVQPGSQAKQLAPFLSSYVGSEWSGPWDYALVIDQNPPAWPDELSLRPESSTQRIAVSMKFPYNPQQDIYKMRLFRKTQDSDGNDLTPWNLLVEYGPQNVLYYDTAVDFRQNNGNVRYVYAAQSVDRHEVYSPLSEQLAATITTGYDVFGEDPIVFVSSAGVKLEHFGAFSTNPPKREMSEVIVVPPEGAPDAQTEPPAQFTFVGRESLGNSAKNQNNYIVRIESLDTGEKQDVPLTVQYFNLPGLTRTIPMAVGVQTSNIGQTSSPPAPDWLTPPIKGQPGSPGPNVHPGVVRRTPGRPPA